MKSLFPCKTVLIFIFIFPFLTLHAQKLVLNGKWKYSPDDDSTFSSVNYNDVGWKEKAADSLAFGADIFHGKGDFLWLRKTIFIPSSLKKELSVTGALAIYLGRIYQSDEFYFNGQMIDATNSSDIKRVYAINSKNIHWDEPNVIALKIQHWDDMGGLETTKAPYIASAMPSAIFTLSSSASGVQAKQQVKDKQGAYNFYINSKAERKVTSLITAVFYNIHHKSIHNSENKKVILSPGNNIISFLYKSSSSFLKVKYTLSVAEDNYTASRNDEFGYDDVVYKHANFIINDKIKEHFTAPDLKQQIIKGWLGDKLNANEEKRLYNIDEDAILAGYINKPGNHPWIGEHVGKFLDAATNTYKNKGDIRLKIMMDRMAQHLIASQLSDGYLGTYTPDNYWTSWDVWSHKYNIIGLLNYYSLSGYAPALDAAKRAGDLLCKTFGYGKGQLDIIKAGEHVGMAATSILEPMVDLYKYTGNKKYLDFCFYIIKSYNQENGPKIISTLDATDGRVDKTANAKAYEMLSNMVGIIKLYKVTGNEEFLKPILLAWNDIVKNRLYITGTASSFEHFTANDDLPATIKDDMGEGCVTVTWLQLNYQLLRITGEMKYVNELERSVYNHLTGAENPESGCVSYYTPLIGVKPYHCDITCCMSSVPRGIAMVPLFANGKINSVPSFLFYEPGTYATTIANNSPVSFTTVTNFPLNGNISINVNNSNATAYSIGFRKPYWAESFSLLINGEKQSTDNNEEIVIKRVWKKGDNIAINFTMPLKVLDGGKSYPGEIALQRGPQVLVFDKSLNNFDADMVSLNSKDLQLQTSSTLPVNWIGNEVFQIKGLLNNSEKKIVLVPYADASQTGGGITTWIKNVKN